MENNIKYYIYLKESLKYTKKALLLEKKFFLSYQSVINEKKKRRSIANGHVNKCSIMETL